MKANLFPVFAIASLGALAANAQTSDDPAGQFVAQVPDEAAFDGGGYTSTDGDALYDSFCAGCHMPDGSGASGAGDYPALAGNPNLEYAAYPITVIVNGLAGMPSLGHLLSDEQVLAITSYIQSELGNGYEPDGDVQLVADSRPVEAEEALAEHEVAEDDEQAERADAAEGTEGEDEAGSSAGADQMAEDSGASASAEGGTGLVRHPIPNSDFPILLAAEIPADATLVYLSGTVPQVIDDSAEVGSPERFGDTAAQTQSTLSSIEEKLAALDLEMGDVVKMQAYLVAPEGGDGMDFSGFMEGYTQFFGTDEQPNLPTRSVFEVAGLANPSWLVEIEVVAVRP